MSNIFTRVGQAAKIGINALVRLAATDPQQVWDNKNIPAKRKGALATYKIKQVRPLRVEMQMDKWRRAVENARDPYLLQRYYLYALYREAMIDPQIISQVGLVEDKLILEPFILEKKNTGNNKQVKSKAKLKASDNYIDNDPDDDNGDGNEIVDPLAVTDPEAQKLMKLFERPWFAKYLELSQQSDWWGHSLIEFQEMCDSDSGVVDQEFCGIKLVPREHVKPEWGEILIYPQELHGFSYREAPFNNWLVEVGDPDTLGALLSASRESIWKTLNRSDWARYNEKFGQPIVHIGSASDDDKELDKKEDMARNLGSNSYLITDVEDKVELIELGGKGSGQTSTYQLLCGYVDDQLSKLFNRQTLTSNSSGVGGAGSYALGNVHEDILDDSMKARLKKREFEINYALIPFLIKHGYPLDGYEYKYPRIKTSSQGSTQSGSPEQNKGGKDPGNPNPDSPNPKGRSNADPNGSKKKVSAHSIDKNIFPGLVSTQTGIKLAAGNDDFLEEMATFAYENRDAEGLLNTDVYLKIAQGLYGKFKEGFKTDYKVSDGGPADFQAYIQQNIFPFSAAKNYSQLKDMNNVLLDDSGKIKSFNVFKNDVAAINADYNQNWLSAEYDLAQNSGVMAGQWQNIEADKEIYPYLRYKGVMDDRERPEHVLLEGITLPVGDVFWYKNYPPNGWRCRCRVDQLMQHEAIPSDSIAANKLAKGAKIPKLFQNNVGLSKMVYLPDHPYYEEIRPYKNIQSSMSAEGNYGLRSVEKILNNDKLPAGPEKLTKEVYPGWVKSFMDKNRLNKNTASIKDVLGMETKIPEAKFGHVLKKEDELRHEYSNRLEDTLQNPNEVWQYFTPRNVLSKSWIKYYADDTAIIIVSTVGDDGIKVETWYKWDKARGTAELNKVRKGILLHLNRTRF